MQRHPGGDSHEREPLDASRVFQGQAQGQAGDAYSQRYPQAESPYHDETAFQALQSSAGNYNYRLEEAAPPQPPRHQDFSSYDHAVVGDSSGQPYSRHNAQSDVTSATNGFRDPVAEGLGVGGVAGLAHQNGRDGGLDYTRAPGQLPPPPSRSQASPSPISGYEMSPTGGYPPENTYSRSFEQYELADQGSRPGLNPFGTPPVSHSPARSMGSLGTESFADDPYQGAAASRGYYDASFGVVNPHEIADDEDDGLSYGQRSSMLRFARSDKAKAGVGAAAVAGAAGAGIGAAAGASSRAGRGPESFGTRGEKSTNWKAEKANRNKRWKWLIMILVALIVVGAIVGGIVGGVVAKNKKSSGSSGQSAADDASKNGDLDINSDEIRALMNNKDLHKVFAGMDYTPLNTQYPDCVGNPPSQNNVTRDVAVLSQLTNKIRLYGTDCNQTQMVIHAVDRLKLKDSVKIWLGVWQDGNDTTNARQLSQMWDILDQYGASPFEGIIVANEILFRKEKTVTQLGAILDGVRSNLTNKNIQLPVASSDLGDDWTSDLAAKSDYIMANIHPFFAGVAAETAAQWTYGFWTGKDKQFWKSDASKNINSETGWPSAGGKDCGGSPVCDSSTSGAVASIDGMNRFMQDWVCQAMANGTNYFWFEAFDEPWKVRFNTPEKGQEWEDKWGLMDVNRKLKPGVKIPDCGGKTV